MYILISINYGYYIGFFFISFSISLCYIITHRNLLSFWILHNILISRIDTIELNIIIINYDQLSEQIRRIIIFINILVYFPFFILYIYLFYICGIENQYAFHWFYFIYVIRYIYILTHIFNHYDFAYSAIIDIYIPNIVQKCVDFSIFFIQYSGYFYDFFMIFFFYIRMRMCFFIWPYTYFFYIRSGKVYNDFTKLIRFRIINTICILYYFGSYSIQINFLIFSINLFCIEFFIIIRRIFMLIQRLKKSNKSTYFIICLKLIWNKIILFLSKRYFILNYINLIILIKFKM